MLYTYKNTTLRPSNTVPKIYGLRSFKIQTSVADLEGVRGIHLNPLRYQIISFTSGNFRKCW